MAEKTTFFVTTRSGTPAHIAGQEIPCGFFFHATPTEAQLIVRSEIARTRGEEQDPAVWTVIANPFVVYEPDQDRPTHYMRDMFRWPTDVRRHWEINRFQGLKEIFVEDVFPAP